MGLAEAPFPHWQGEPWRDTSGGLGLAVYLGELDEAEAAGTPAPSCGHKLAGSLLGIPHKAHSLKKGRARAVWNNNLMLTVALTESQAQAQLGHGWAPASEITLRQGGWTLGGGSWGTGQEELINRAQPGSEFRGGGCRRVG